MKSGTKALLTTLAMLCVSAALIIGGTYALFTDTVSINNRLSAGNLEVGLVRVSYQEHVLSKNGMMATSALDITEVDLTKSEQPLFQVVNAVPTSWYQTTVRVSNLGSTAFDYGMRIIWAPNSDPLDNDHLLAEQIRITVASHKIADADRDGIMTLDGEDMNYVSFTLKEASLRDISLGYLLKNAGDDSFTVKAEFVDSGNNNAAMLATLTFDLQVYATQKVEMK